MSEYVFQAEICATGFSREIELIAEFDYFPACKGSRDEYGQLNEPDEEAEIEITLIRSALDNPEPSDLIIAEMLNETMDTDQLVDEIFASGDY